ncbi:caspase, EACC1-associated type [Kitasatospora sp. HPMI-4]|uniref:caspase, EACC1-associated type n=1 Tax=Kitasatospora sp. HPMI-4 TaxID=3448443 RepID=UPI003F1D165F
MSLPEPDDGFGQPVDPVALARPGSRVLLVGTGRHPAGSPLPAVEAVEASLNDLAAALREQAGVPDGNLRILLDPASPLEFGRTAAQVAAEATETLVIHYVGHGLVGPDGELYLATRATDDLVDGLSYTALPYPALRQVIRDCRARTVVVVLDCCFSGRADTPSGPPVLDSVFEQTMVRGGFLLTSTAREEHGLAAPGAAHTAFTGALIRLLREGDPAGPEQLTLDHVHRYLSRVLPQEGAPRPRRHSSDQAGELVLARNPAYLVRPVTSPVTGGLDDADASGERGGVQAPCPFRGLASFGPEDARFFFGRAGVVSQVTRRIVADGGLVAVVGASGCGKTSLLRAGVVPALEGLSHGWRVAFMTPGSNPVETLTERAAALAGHESAVLLVDQFEELFTSGASEDERERFIRDLTALAAGPAVVVVAVRADFYEACTRYAPLVRALEGRQVVVGPMGPDELRTVIEQPARAAGLRLEEGLTETLLREARVRHRGEQSAVLPLLSHALLVTWQQRSGDLLTLAGYRSAGGVDEAVARTAEQVYAEVAVGDRPAVRALLLRLVRLGEGVEDTRRRLPLADLADPGHMDPAGRVLDALAAARLVTVDGEGAEITHEALLYAWPRLRAWIDEDRAALLTGQQLADAARAWDQAGRLDADLYRGVRVETAAHMVRERPRIAEALGPLAREFLDRSLEQQRAEQRAALRRRRRGRTALALVCVLALLAALVGGIAVQQRRDAARQTAIVHSNDLAADAEAYRTLDPGLAGQLAIAAYRYSPTQAATTQLYATPEAPLLDSVVGDTGSQVMRVAVQQDGPLAAASSAATGGPEGTLRIWDLTDPLSPVLEATVKAATTAIAFAPHRRLLAGGCAAVKGLCLWNIADPRRPSVAAQLPLPGDLPQDRRFTAMTASPDGTLLAAALTAGFTLVWSIAQPSSPRLLAELPNPSSRGTDTALAGVAFAPRGDLLADTVLGGATRLWNVTDPAAPTRVAMIDTGYQSVAFGPDGSELAAVGDTDIGLWNLKDAAHPAQVRLTTGIIDPLMAVAFSPDGKRLAYGTAENENNKGELCVQSLPPADASGQAEPVCSTLGTSIYSLAYTASGALLTGGYDGLVRLWRSPLTQIGEAATFGHSSWDFSPDGHLMVAPIDSRTSDLPSTTGLWDLSAPDGPGLVSTLPVAPDLVAFLSPTALVIVVRGGAVQLWNIGDPHHPVRAASLGTAVFPTSVDGGIISYGVSWDQEGDLVAVLGSDKRLHLWRVGSSLGATEVGSIPHPDAATGYAGVLPDGRTALLFTKDGLDWWDTSDPAHPVHGVLWPAKGAIGCSARSAGNLFVITAGDQCGHLYLTDVSAGRMKSHVRLTGSPGDVLGISDDGRLVAVTGSGNDTVALWDTGDPQHPNHRASMHTVQNVTGISFDRADHLMAVWSSDTVQLWDVSRPSAPALLVSFSLPNKALVNETVFSPSGSTLFVTGAGGVYLIDTDPARLADRLCSYTGGSITAEQWQDYAPGIPFRHPCPSR